MSGSNGGGNTTQGVHSGTGGPPLVVVHNPCGGSNQLPLPPTLYEDLDHDQRRRLNMVQLEYARDVALLESRAYDALLKVLLPSRDD